MTLADRVVVMNQGRIEQVGEPNHLYHAPATRFVAGFIGSPAMNFLPCALERRGGGGLEVRLTDKLAFNVPESRTKRYEGHVGRKDLSLGLRPEHLTDARSVLEPGQQRFDVTLTVTEPMGMETLVYFAIDGTELCGRVSPNAGATNGGRIALAAHLEHMHLIDGASGKVI
jgi:multiple sugar transport system ATP-binding protein